MQEVIHPSSQVSKDQLHLQVTIQDIIQAVTQVLKTILEHTQEIIQAPIQDITQEHQHTLVLTQVHIQDIILVTQFNQVVKT